MLKDVVRDFTRFVVYVGLGIGCVFAFIGVFAHFWGVVGTVVAFVILLALSLAVIKNYSFDKESDDPSVSQIKNTKPGKKKPTRIWKNTDKVVLSLKEYKKRKDDLI